MKSLTYCYSLTYILFCVQQLPAEMPVLQKTGAMLVEGVAGEFDHLAIDLARQRLYVAAEDQKTVEVFDLTAQKHIGTISLFKRPHGLVFSPTSSQLIVADGGDGTVKFVDTEAPKISSQIKTALRADSVAFDPASQTLFVANGGLVAKLDYSFVTAVNTSSAERTGEIKLDSKILEAMAIEKGSSRLFINRMDKNDVMVIDRLKNEVLGIWPLPVEQPSAMALDEANHRLFIACRKPGRLVVLNTHTGKAVTDLPCIGHADDAFYDSAAKKIYVSGGEGAVSVYQQRGPDQYVLQGNVETGLGAKTSLLVPELNRLFVAVPATSSRPGEVLIFSTGK
ncbi:MAG: Pyrrolo-quinoline quinone beta-propeller repeat-containing protein [Bryobacterales bacterium]|nr:Pyrrolo-quinoline quinone beta-propeller repeat-containing protein [Bryobacterales bacterium]